MMFRCDLIESRLASWNELLQRLASVQMLHGSDEFRLGVTNNGVFLVGSMYKAFIEAIQPVINNNSIWKIKIALKTKVFCMVPSSWCYSY
jgi:hypothetical protein